jgi:DNA processing protein
LLISQVPIYRYDHQPLKAQRFYFPERNITMAALSEATVIVEAGETSGVSAGRFWPRTAGLI